jgi:hypothetical protein
MPCTLICLTPVIIAAWPSIMSYVAGAVATLGLTAVKVVGENKTSVENQTEEVEMELGSVQGGEISNKQVFTKDGIIFTVKCDEQGQLILCAKGNETKERLREKATTLAGKIQQAYAYHKAMTQLRTTGFKVVAENIGQEQEIRVTLRRS